MASMSNNQKDKNNENIIVKIIKTNSENWFSFLSGIFANIPITLLLMLSKPSDKWVYWLLYALAIVISIALVVFSIMLTIKIINIKEVVKEKYDQYVAEKKSLAPVKYTYYLKEECTQRYKLIIGIGIASIVSFILLLALIIALWFLL